MITWYVFRKEYSRKVEFEGDKLKIFIIGESFSEDFINIPQETLDIDDISLSSLYLPAESRNVLLAKKLSKSSSQEKLLRF